MDSLKRLFTGGALAVIWVLACSFSPAAAFAAENGSVPASPSLPDLAVTTLNISPETPSAGDTVTISVGVQNIGETASTACILAYFIDEKEIASTTLDALPANAKSDVTFIWKAQGGSHVLRATADANNQVNETSKDNNSKTMAFSTMAPDLVITAISWTPANPSIGDNLTFTVSIANQGNKRSGSCQLDFSIDGASRGLRVLLALEPGGTSSETYTWSMLSGNHTIAATADALQSIAESNKANNRMEATLTPALPDLIISLITVTPTDLKAGDSVLINVFVKNRGTGRAAPSQMICYIDDLILGLDWIGYLRPDDSENWTFGWTTDGNPHTIKAVADATNALIESDETNNVKTVPSPTILPDLYITGISWDPVTPKVNEPATFTIGIGNQGKAMSPPTELKYGFNTFYQFTAYVPELDIGESCNTTIMFTPLYPSFTVNAAVDMDNKIKESNKANNSLVRQVGATKITASADLTVSSLTLTPASPLLGQTAILSLAMKNKGSGTAGPFFTAVYLDDQQINTLYNDSLAAGATEIKDVLINLKDLPVKSSYAIRVQMDSSNIVPETDEFNNNGEMSFSLSMPVLAVQDITWEPSTPGQGDIVNFIVTVTNGGAATSPSSRISYYIDNTYAGQHLIDPLQPGENATRQFSWKVLNVPFTFTAGIDQTLNSKSVTVPAPDLLIDSITWQPDTPKEIDQVTFTVSISNLGKGPSPATKLYLYIDNGAPMTVNTPEIASGDRTSVTFAANFISGDHDLKFIPNGDQAVVETNQSNNAKIIKFTVQPLSIKAAVPAPVTTTSSPKTSTAPTQTTTQAVKATAAKPTATAVKSNAPDASSGPPLWQSLLMNKWLLICVVLIGIGVIGLLWLSRKRAATKPAKEKTSKTSKPAPAPKANSEAAKPVQAAKPAQSAKPAQAAKSPANNPENK
ncbi:MAG TPA: CARDB domain-containing protein [Dehalococcoidales bacterium]|nr:CARDB domain-containing protein [Dehalococcoidales bacterium]